MSSPPAALTADASARIAPAASRIADGEPRPTRRQTRESFIKAGNGLDALRLKLPARAAVFEVGARADQLYVVHEGGVTLSRPLAHERRSIFDWLGRERMFGLSAGAEHDYDAIASEPSVIYIYDKRRLMADPARALGVHEEALRQMARMRWLACVRCLPALARLASFLIDLGEASGGAARLKLPLSRAEIADYLDLKIETVSRTMTTLRDCGAVETTGQRGLAVIDPDRLRAFAFGEPLAKTG